MRLPRTREWRESRGLTQRQLAEKAAVGPATIPRIERGESVLPTSAKKIADALGIEVADLTYNPPRPSYAERRLPWSLLEEFVEERRSQRPLSLNEAWLNAQSQWNVLEDYVRDFEHLDPPTRRRTFDSMHALMDALLELEVGPHPSLENFFSQVRLACQYINLYYKLARERGLEEARDIDLEGAIERVEAAERVETARKWRI